jgi:hypothetical protein
MTMTNVRRKEVKDEQTDIDAAIDRVLLVRPGATPSQIRSLVPVTARLSDNNLTARLERLRSKLVRISMQRPRTRDAYE